MYIGKFILMLVFPKYAFLVSAEGGLDVPGGGGI